MFIEIKNRPIIILALENEIYELLLKVIMNKIKFSIYY